MHRFTSYDIWLIVSEMRLTIFCSLFLVSFHVFFFPWVLYEEIGVLSVIKRRELYGQLAPFAECLLLGAVRDHKVLDMEAGTLDAFIQHHWAPLLLRNETKSNILNECILKEIHTVWCIGWVIYKMFYYLFLIIVYLYEIAWHHETLL